MGRVVTLLDAAAHGGGGGSGEPLSSPRVYGRAFRLTPSAAEACIHALCVRERAGYAALTVPIHCEDGVSRDAWVFAAGPDNAFFTGEGERDEESTARTIVSASGPSGSNLDYFLHLHAAMSSKGVSDSHLDRLWELVLRQCPAAAARAAEIRQGRAHSPKGEEGEECS